MRKLLSTTPRRYHQVATAALILLTVIVFTGSAVRLTGSGLGCHGWPSCEKGEVVAPLQTHAVIEFTNRSFSGIVAIVTIAAGLLAFFRVPPRRDLKLLGMLLPLGVVGQAVLGGLAVVYDLKPGFVMGHFALSLLLLVASWALYWRSKPEWEEGLIEPGAADRLTMWATRLLLPIGSLMVIAGTAATAAGPHAGGAGTGDLVDRLYVKGSDTLSWTVANHTTIGIIFGIAAIAALGIAWYRGASQQLVRVLTGLVVLLGVQGLIGAIQYQSKLPAELVWVHVCLATITWLVILWAWSVAGTPAVVTASDVAPADGSASPA